MKHLRGAKAVHVPFYVCLLFSETRAIPAVQCLSDGAVRILMSQIANCFEVT
jgi:hypothetical protein